MNYNISKIIKDLLVIELEIFNDFRGEFINTYNENDYKFYDTRNEIITFVEDDVSVSSKNVLHGLHGDDKTWKLIQCLYGEVYFVVADLRKESPSYLRWQSFTLNDKNRIQILIPAGCVNGHLCLTEKCIFSYKQSVCYSDGKDQISVRWNDPKLNICWPNTNPILSQRDYSAPFL